MGTAWATGARVGAGTGATEAEATTVGAGDHRCSGRKPIRRKPAQYIEATDDVIQLDTMRVTSRGQGRSRNESACLELNETTIPARQAPAISAEQPEDRLAVMFSKSASVSLTSKNFSVVANPHDVRTYEIKSPNKRSNRAHYRQASARPASID